ncbi:MAG: hypothetical protein IJX17_05420 [Clostridia bacterium]|nr:hypothetical protein [Clostridia bacterium]
MQNYYEILDVFKPIKNEEFIEIKIPVAMDLTFNILSLKILPLENGYIICDDGKTFKRLNNTSMYYFNIFIEKDTNDHFDIMLDGDRIYKKYPYDFNIRVAVNEFVRFFVYLDDFISNNNLI